MSLEQSRSTGKISSTSGSQALSNIPTPVRFIGADVETGANFCNATIYNGSNSNAALFFIHCHPSDYISYDLHIPVFAEYGLWLEMGGGDGSNILIRYC